MIIYIDEKREIINISSTNDIYTKELLTIMVIRSGHPRLPGRFHGKIIYATPGSGKTFVANKYRDSASRSDEERKKRWAETISKTATKYGFDSSEAYLAAVKKLEDEDEVKELREQIEQLMKNRASGK